MFASQRPVIEATMTWRKIVVLVVFAIAILVLASFKMYYIRDDGGVDIVWNKSEGYLFLSVVRRGYHFRYMEYPMVAMLQYFGSIRLPDDHRSSITVLRVTSSEVQRYVSEDIPPLSFYTPFDQTIYANREGVLWKWAGSRFEQATADEQGKFGGTNRLSAQGFTDVRGWSSLPRVTSGPPEVEVAMEVGGQPLTLLVKRGYNESDISIDRLRPGYAPERIWALDERPRMVSEMDYEHFFEKR
jgi:hypothetical protein